MDQSNSTGHADSEEMELTDDIFQVVTPESRTHEWFMYRFKLFSSLHPPPKELYTKTMKTMRKTSTRASDLERFKHAEKEIESLDHYFANPKADNGITIKTPIDIDDVYKAMPHFFGLEMILRFASASKLKGDGHNTDTPKYDLKIPRACLNWRKITELLETKLCLPSTDQKKLDLESLLSQGDMMEGLDAFSRNFDAVRAADVFSSLLQSTMISGWKDGAMDLLLQDDKIKACFPSWSPDSASQEQKASVDLEDGKGFSSQKGHGKNGLSKTTTTNYTCPPEGNKHGNPQVETVKNLLGSQSTTKPNLNPIELDDTENTRSPSKHNASISDTSNSSSSSISLGLPTTNGHPLHPSPLTKLHTLHNNLYTSPPGFPSDNTINLTFSRPLNLRNAITYPRGIRPPNQGCKYETEFLMQFRDKVKFEPCMDWGNRVVEGGVLGVEGLVGIARGVLRPF